MTTCSTSPCPGRYGEPFLRPGVVLLGAGSSGLRHGTDPQQSIASALLLSFEAVSWGWSLEVRRIVFNVSGRVSPDVAIKTDKPQSIFLTRGQPLEPTTAIGRSFDKLRTTLDTGSGAAADRFDPSRDKYEPFVLWVAPPDGKLTIKRLDPDPWESEDRKGVTDSNGPDQALASDLARVYLSGLEHWLTGPFYGDDLTFALSGLRTSHDGQARCSELEIALRIDRFSSTALFNWAIKNKILRTGPSSPQSFREKYVLPELTRLRNSLGSCHGGSYCDGGRLLDGLVAKFPYLSWRCETTVLATVKAPAGAEEIVITQRSDNVAISRGGLQLFASGGCRPAEGAGYEVGDRAQDSPRELRRAVGKELGRETGYQVRGFDNEMKLVALYLDPQHFTPVWLHWLEFDEETFEAYLKQPDKGRDSWEAVKRFRVPIKSTWEELLAEISRESQDLDMVGDSMLGLRLWFDWQKSAVRRF